MMPVDFETLLIEYCSGFADRARRTPGLQVVWLRIGNTTNASLRARLEPHLSAVEAALESGEFLIEVQ